MGLPEEALFEPSLENGDHFLDRKERGRSLAGGEFLYPRGCRVEEPHLLWDRLTDALEQERGGAEAGARLGGTSRPCRQCASPVENDTPDVCSGREVRLQRV